MLKFALSLLIACGAAAATVPASAASDADDVIQAQPVRPPNVAAVVDFGTYTQSDDTLNASWVATGTNLTEYKYAIGTSVGATNVVPWTSVGLNPSVTRTGLSLLNGWTYYFSVRAYNDSGDFATGNSDGIKVDLVNPTLGPVVDDGDYTATEDSLTFSFSGSDTDSGVKEYYYAIGTGANYQALVPWTSSGLVTSRTVSGLHLIEDETYFISVYVLDNAGRVTTGYSDGIALDASPPKMGYVIDAGAIATDATELSASWGATDPMGVAGYQFAVGTTMGGSNVAAWQDVGLNTTATATGLSLQTGSTYYLSVKATDVSGRTAAASSDGIRLEDGSPFAIDDVRMGDRNACYTNPEFSGDSRYMVWGERINKLNDAGEGITRMWHCAIDPETGGFIPFDCRGFSGFDSTDRGRAYLGRDRQGLFYLGANADYQLTMTRITGPTSGTTTTIPSLIDPERRGIYPSVLPGSSRIYAYWLKSHGITPAPEDAEWVDLRYVDIADPTNEVIVDHQVNTDGLVPLDITFPRWAYAKPLLMYGHQDTDGTTNIYQVDVSQPELPPVQITDDWHVKTGPLPILYQSTRHVVAGIDGTTESLVYAQPPGGGLYDVVDSFSPPANETFPDACLSNSHQPFAANGSLYTTYQITNCEGEPPDGFGFLHHPGQIWFAQLLSEAADLRRISFSNSWVRNEPEPVIGASRAWVYYSAYPGDQDQTDACPQVRRSATPIGLSGS